VKKINVKNLGLISYDDGMRVMKDLHAKRCANLIPDTMLVLQHHPVITKGRRMHGQDIPFHPELKKRGVQIREADRGGLLTYHGPGQIVVYFIVRFSDYFSGITDMVKIIEKSLQGYLKTHSVITRLLPDHPGIWVGPKKIASIGLRVSKGVTTHGISLNINNELDVYQLFDPCGMSGNNMTNLSQTLNRNPSDADVEILADQLVIRFQEDFSFDTDKRNKVPTFSGRIN